MIRIEAYIKPFKLDDVQEALEEIGVAGMTVTEVLQGMDTPTRGRSPGGFGGARDTSLVPKIKIEVAVPFNLAERVIEALCLHGSAGKKEDGRIIVERLNAAVRIRTGDEGEDALSF